MTTLLPWPSRLRTQYTVLSIVTESWRSSPGVAKTSLLTIIQSTSIGSIRSIERVRRFWFSHEEVARGQTVDVVREVLTAGGQFDESVSSKLTLAAAVGLGLGDLNVQCSSYIIASFISHSTTEELTFLHIPCVTIERCCRC